MFKLTILKADGSTYWVEHADKRESLQAWLAEEETRPYWDPTYTHTIEPVPGTERTPEEIAEREAKEAARLAKVEARKAKLATAKGLMGKSRNPAETTQLLDLMAEMLFDEDIGLVPAPSTTGVKSK